MECVVNDCNKDILYNAPYKEQISNFFETYCLINSGYASPAEREIFSKVLINKDNKVDINGVTSAIVSGYAQIKKNKEGVSLGAVKMETTSCISNEARIAANKIITFDFVENVYILVKKTEVELWVIVTEKSIENRKKIFEVVSNYADVVPIIIKRNQLDEENMPLFNLKLF